MMTTRLLARAMLTALVAAAPLAGASAQRLTGSDSRSVPPAPVTLDETGLFQAKFASVGSDVFIAGQPTEQALREMKARGVTTVVNLRSPEEMARIGFDEAALVKSLGMTYVHLPMRGNEALPYSPAAVEAFATAMQETEGKLLLHCTIAWRASHLWAAYLIEVRKVPIEMALSQARLVNLMDDHRMDGDTQPLEQFLGRKVPGLGSPRSP
jgi:uncharacterized protein (TIGR01244 family)